MLTSSLPLAVWVKVWPVPKMSVTEEEAEGKAAAAAACTLLLAWRQTSLGTLLHLLSGTVLQLCLGRQVSTVPGVQVVFGAEVHSWVGTVVHCCLGALVHSWSGTASHFTLGTIGRLLGAQEGAR